MNLENLFDLLAANGIREWVVQIPPERSEVSENDQVQVDLDAADPGAQGVQQNEDGSIVYPDPEGIDHTVSESREPVVPAGLPEGTHYSGDVLVIPEPEADPAVQQEAAAEVPQASPGSYYEERDGEQVLVIPGVATASEEGQEQSQEGGGEENTPQGQENPPPADTPPEGGDGTEVASLEEEPLSEAEALARQQAEQEEE